jgi:alkanesulfonate monooxygenase SsuD/methylene tetrahydromethanopterin reductase-like flavin-dependent oxidoreductase (luciferase family)
MSSSTRNLARLSGLPGLWSGKPFRFQGEHYHIDPITFLPPPVQTPGIPLWIGGMELARD